MLELFDEAKFPLLSYQNTLLVFMFSVPFQMSENLTSSSSLNFFFFLLRAGYMSQRLRVLASSAYVAVHKCL